jgi:hypothetical protein
MGKAVVSIARLVTIHTMTIRRVLLVVLAHTAIKFFNLRMFRANHARRGPIRPPKVCPVLAGATIVPRANIQRKKETPRKANATIVTLIHLVPNLDETNRVTRVKKERHQRKVQPFVLAVVLVPI